MRDEESLNCFLCRLNQMVKIVKTNMVSTTKTTTTAIPAPMAANELLLLSVVAEETINIIHMM